MQTKQFAHERVQSFSEHAADALSATGRRTAERAGEAQARATGTAGDFKDRAAETADKVKAGIDAASETAQGTMERVRSTARDRATAAPEAVRHVFSDNAALIAGLGVAIGAIVAASLPATEAEAATIGKAGDRVKRAAGEAAQSGFETAKDDVLSAADAAAKSVSDEDLSKQASRATKDLSDKLREAGDDIVTAAFNPTRTEEKPS